MMKNLENRVTKLEMQIPKNDFLIVFAKKGETRESAIDRAVQKKNTKRPETDFYIIYLNLHSK